MKKDFTRSLEDFQYELKKKDYELTQQIMGEIEGILKSIGQSGGYTMIIDSSVLIYYSQATDITNQVIQAYDAK
jgi:Skp family chaperone for outer membrane proteins